MPGRSSHTARLALVRRPRRFALVIALAATVASAAHAAEPGSAQAPAVGEVVVNGQRPAACSATAPGGHGLNFACLDGQVKAAAAAGAPAPPAIDATPAQASTPSQVGTFSHAATAERLGKTFGRSAQPYRPPPPVYANPITAGKPR